MYAAELAKKAGISSDTVRYYSKIGMLKPRRNEENDYRVYNLNDARRLRFIRAAKSLGYSLADIRAIFADADRGHSPCPRVRAVLEHNIEETRQRLKELNELHNKMEQALASWQEMPDSHPTGNSVCSLIESLDDLT